MQRYTMEFVADRRFPRFSVKAGELWHVAVSEVEGESTGKKSRLEILRSGVGSFPFAGGECPASEVRLHDGWVDGP